jgi:hypothetical protein
VYGSVGKESIYILILCQRKREITQTSKYGRTVCSQLLVCYASEFCVHRRDGKLASKMYMSAVGREMVGPAVHFTPTRLPTLPGDRSRLLLRAEAVWYVGVPNGAVRYTSSRTGRRRTQTCLQYLRHCMHGWTDDTRWWFNRRTFASPATRPDLLALLLVAHHRQARHRHRHRHMIRFFYLFND